ncbi:MAG: hypothetical protein U9O95_00630 [Candidatus Marinimicrobia bacterium]|nr:hypothetical protein [Candidatus Neomarinimicrobiota bacterium]
MKRTNTFAHYRMNLRLGMFSFLTHRITGVILLLAGLIILLSLSVIMLGRTTFEEMLVLLHFPIFRILSHVVVIALYWHILNGIKILIIDLFRAGLIHKLLTIIMIITFVIGIMIYFVNVYPGLIPS